MTPRKNNSEAGKTAEPKKTSQPITFRYVGSIIILVIVVITFVIVSPLSTGPDSGGVSEIILGSYAGVPISYAAGNYYSKQVDNLDSYYGASVQQKDQSYINFIWGQAFTQTAIHLGILDSAKSAGFSVTSNYLDQEILTVPNFIEDGKFSLKKFQETPSSIQLDIRNDIRDNYIKNGFLGDVLFHQPSAAELEFIKVMVRRERSFEFITFPLSSYPDSEKAAFGSSKPELFKSISLSRITVLTGKADAEALRKKILDKTLPFGEAAKNSSNDIYKTADGVMGLKRFHELQNEFKNAEDIKTLFGLAKGEISAVFESAVEGFAFYQVVEAAADPVFTDPDTLKSVASYMETWERGKIEEYAMTQASAFLSETGKDYKAAASKRKLAFKPAGPFQLNYGNAFSRNQGSPFRAINPEGNTELAGIENNEKFLKELWKTPIGSFALPVLVSENIIVLRVTEEKNLEDPALIMTGYYYPQIVSQSFESDYYDKINQSPKLINNVVEALPKIFNFQN